MLQRNFAMTLLIVLMKLTTVALFNQGGNCSCKLLEFNLPTGKILLENFKIPGKLLEFFFGIKVGILWL